MIALRNLFLAVVAAAVLGATAPPPTAAAAGTFEAAVIECRVTEGVLTGGVIGVTVSGAQPGTPILLGIVPKTSGDSELIFNSGLVTDAGGFAAGPVLGAPTISFPLSLKSYADLNGDLSGSADEQIGDVVTVPLVCREPSLSLSGSCRYDIPALPGREYTHFLVDAVITGLVPNSEFAFRSVINGQVSTEWRPLLADATGSWDDDTFLIGYLVPEELASSNTFDITVYVDLDRDRMADPDEILASSSLTVTCVRTVDELLEAAFADGSLSSGEASSLFAKVEAAGASLDRDNIKAAINQLGALISELRAAIDSGRVAQSLGNQLIGAAERQIRELEARL